MRWILTAPAFVVLLATSPAVMACPPKQDIAQAETEIFAKIRQTARGDVAAELNDDLWKLWTKAPDAKAQMLLDTGMAALRLGDFGHAEIALDALIAYCPDYAEGYNQRAFASYLQFDYAKAIELLHKAEARSPRHLGVLTGLALSHVALGDVDAAQDPLRRAVALNPFLSERALLLEPLGEEL